MYDVMCNGYITRLRWF